MPTLPRRRTAATLFLVVTLLLSGSTPVEGRGTLRRATLADDPTTTDKDVFRVGNIHNPQGEPSQDNNGQDPQGAIVGETALHVYTDAVSHPTKHNNNNANDHNIINDENIMQQQQQQMSRQQEQYSSVSLDPFAIDYHGLEDALTEAQLEALTGWTDAYLQDFWAEMAQHSNNQNKDVVEIRGLAHVQTVMAAYHAPQYQKHKDAGKSWVRIRYETRLDFEIPLARQQAATPEPPTKEQLDHVLVRNWKSDEYNQYLERHIDEYNNQNPAAPFPSLQTTPDSTLSSDAANNETPTQNDDESSREETKTWGYFSTMNKPGKAVMLGLVLVAILTCCCATPMFQKRKSRAFFNRSIANDQDGLQKSPKHERKWQTMVHYIDSLFRQQHSEAVEDLVYLEDDGGATSEDEDTSQEDNDNYSQDNDSHDDDDDDAEQGGKDDFFGSPRRPPGLQQQNNNDADKRNDTISNETVDNETETNQQQHDDSESDDDSQDNSEDEHDEEQALEEGEHKTNGQEEDEDKQPKQVVVLPEPIIAEIV